MSSGVLIYLLCLSFFVIGGIYINLDHHIRTNKDKFKNWKYAVGYGLLYALILVGAILGKFFTDFGLLISPCYCLFFIVFTIAMLGLYLEAFINRNK